MRLLWVSNRADLGGAELALAEGVSALSARGHEVHVVLPREGPLRERLRAAATVHVCYHNPWAAERVRPLLAARWLLYDVLVAAPEIARHSRRVGAELILTNTVVSAAGGLAARRVRLPHGWFLHEFGGPDHGVRYFLGARTAFWLMGALGDCFLVNSAATHRYFRERLPGERIHPVRYSVDIEDSGPGRRAPRDRLRIILVGAKAPSKGQHEAITAVAKLVARGVDVELELVGSSMNGYEAKLKELAEELGVCRNVQFVSFCDNPAPRLAAADVALMCSRAEAFGRVTVEAMKVGTPVVGADAGATPELISDGRNGLLYRAGDAEDLAGRLLQLDRDREAIRELGLRAQEWARGTFTADAYALGLEAGLEAALARHARR